MNKTLYIIVAIFFFTFLSCQKPSIEIDNWSPELAMPIINSTITIADLIPEKGTTQYDEDGFIRLKFRNDSIYVLNPDLLLGITDLTSLNIDTAVVLEQLLVSAGESDPLVSLLIEQFDIELPFPEEGQEIIGQPFSIINESLIEPFNFEFDEFSEASFESGLLEIEITNNLPISIENVQIQISTGYDNPGNIEISDLLAGASTSQTINLSGLTINNNIDIEVINLEIENVGTDIVQLTPQTGFEILFSINDVVFSNILFSIGGGVVDVDLALFEDFDSGLILGDPTFTINVNNPFDITGAIQGDLFAFSQYGSSDSLHVDLDVFPNGTSQATYYEDQIGAIIALPPQSLEYNASASIALNPLELSQINNNTSLLLGVDIDFPLNVNAANISLRDTIIFDGLDYDISKIERLLLHYNLINGFPLGTEFNLVLHDSLNPTFNLDTLEFISLNNAGTNIIDPAIVDEQGYVIESVVSSGFLNLTQNEIENFLSTNKIIVDITLSTSNSQNEEQYVKIYSNYECLLKIGVETEINFN